MEKLTDKRRTYTFYVDDAVLDIFGPQVGAYGIAVYTLLARHAKHKQCFPSYKIIQQKLGIGRMTVVRTLSALEKAGLITIETRKSTVGDYDTKLYTLCDLSPYRGGGTCEVPPDTPQVPPDTCERPGVVPVGYQGGTCEVPEGISLKGSHLKEREREPPPPPARRCPAGYEPTEAVRQWAQEKYPAVNFEEALEAMRDCEFQRAHRDWHAVMRNWIRREAKWSNGSTRTGSRLTKDEQRAMADKQSTQELEDLVHGRNTRFSVWAPLGSNGASLPAVTRRGSQSGLSHGTG